MKQLRYLIPAGAIALAAVGGWALFTSPAQVEARRAR